jgi:lipoyl(octanoyl) transferase
MEHIKIGQDHFYFKELLPYEDFLKWQSELQQVVREKREEAHFICCSHPPVFTLGRGLQKKTGQELIEFDATKIDLPHSLFTIKRGGGLTFHHPGQFIFYAIVNLNRKNWNLKFHYDFLLKNTQRVLQSFGLETFCSITPAGLWKDSRKLASIGVGVEHFVTSHGLALNLSFSEADKNSLELTHPCGLDASLYKSVSYFLEKDLTFGDFSSAFKKELIPGNRYLEF